MPWRVRKRSCKQKSTGRDGSHVVVKVKRGGGEEQASCHLSEPKARGAVRARYASKNEASLRALIRKVLTEAADDVVQMGVRIRAADRVALNDVLTNLRGVVNVITVRQEGSLEPTEGGFKFVNLFVTFEDDEGRDVYTLQRDIKAIDGVEAVQIKNYEGRKWSDVEKTYTGGAASKEQK
jgi:translation elongation factor EF-1beta